MAIHNAEHPRPQFQIRIGPMPRCAAKVLPRQQDKGRVCVSLARTSDRRAKREKLPCALPLSTRVWASKKSGSHLFPVVYCRLTFTSNSASWQKEKQITVPRRRKPFFERSHTGCTSSASAGVGGQTRSSEADGEGGTRHVWRTSRGGCES